MAPTNSAMQSGPTTTRPPLYNAEDYASALRGLFTHSLPLPHATPTIILEHSTTHPNVPGQGVIDMGYSAKEMGMKKFINGSELLFKLESDLRSAFPSFVQEFVSGESDGVICILDALRTIHEALDHVNGLREQRKLVLDERSCVQCINLMMRNIDAVHKLLNYPHGLYPIVHCTVSTNTTTRILALEILTNVCESGGQDAYPKVSEAISTLRLRLGEPTRCKVLVGAITSAAAGVFQATAIRFFTKFIQAAPNNSIKVYLQVELVEAGLHVDVIRKSAELSPARESRLVIQELDEWDNINIDVDTIIRQNSQLRNSVATLQQEIATLKDKIKKDDSLPTKKYAKKKPAQARNLCTPIQTIVTPVDSEEEAEQIHQILEDLHNIVNNEMLQTESSSSSEIVPTITRDRLPTRRVTNSEPNLFESEHTIDLLEESSDELNTPPRVRNVVQKLEQSNVFSSTLPNFNTTNLASKFANFKSSKLEQQKWREESRVKSLENLDNFTLKWKYPSPEQQPNSLVLQDYRMNRFSSKKVPVPGPSTSGGGIFSKSKKKHHQHAQKTFQISLVSKNVNGESKMTNLSYNDLDRGNSGNQSPNLERVLDLPSGMY